MRAQLFYMAIVATLVGAALAQPPGQVDSAACKAEQASVEQDMALARSKGQMLRRRQLGETLAAVQARCGTLPPEQTNAANIERLEHEIGELRKELEHSEEQLRRLKQEAR